MQADQYNDSFFSFISSINHVLRHHGHVLPASSLSTLFDLYSETGDYVKCLRYVEELIGGVFYRIDCDNLSSLKKHAASDFFLVCKDGHRWCVSYSRPEKNDYTSVYCFYCNGTPSPVNLTSIIVFWFRERDLFFRYLILSLFLSLASLSVPLYMNAVYGRVFPAQAENSLWTLSAIIVALFILEFYLKLKRTRLSSHLIKSYMIFREPAVIRSYLSTPAPAALLSDSVRNQGIDNILKLRRCIRVLLTSGYIDSVFIFIHFIAIAVIAKWLVLIPAAILVFQIILIIYHNKVREVSDPGNNHDVKSLPSSLINGYAINGLTDYFSTFFIERSISANAKDDKRHSDYVVISSLFAFISSLQTVLLVIFAFYLITEQVISPSSLFAAIILAGKITQSSAMLLSFLPFQKEMSDTLSSVNSHIDSCLSVPSGSLCYSTSWSLRNAVINPRSGVARSGFSNLNFSIEPGEKVAVLGPAGSGKSLLSSALGGIVHPDEGVLALPEFLKPGMAHNLFYSPQKGMILRRNLHDSLFGEASIVNNRAEVLEQLTFLSWLPDFFPGGIHSEPVFPLNEEQLQMLEMARLHLSDRTHFILDEPTAAVDSAVENSFVSILRGKLSAESTLILFTRSSALLRLVDRVIYLDGHQILFDGNRGDFLELSTPQPEA